MITLGTRVRVVAFVLIGLAVLGYVGQRYADLGHYVGMRGYYVVTVDLGNARGVFTNAEVTYRGVSVGRVGAMRLTDDGVDVELNISDSAPRIPVTARAVVADRSAVGEQYVDLRPTTHGGPYLSDGSRIARERTRTPIPVTMVLTSLDELAASVPAESLRTVVDELDRALAGQGENLQTLLDASGSLTRAASAHLAPTTGLIDDAQGVLATQRDEGEALVSFAHSLELLAGQLDQSDPDIRRLIGVAPRAAAEVTGLLRDTDPGLAVVLANLLTVSEVTLTRRAGVEEALVALPAAVAATSTAVTTAAANFGLAVTFFNPLPCVAGYEGTTVRNGLDTSPGPPLNTGARCAAPAGSGVGVRGSAHAPTGGVPPAALPGRGTPQSGAVSVGGLLGLAER